MKRFGMAAAPAADTQVKVLAEEHLRISVLSPRILRLEMSPGNQFEDRPSQKIMCRNFGTPKYVFKNESDKIIVETGQISFDIDKRNLAVEVSRDGKKTDSRTGNRLGGTYRTLDRAIGDYVFFDGKIQLQDSLFADNGVTEIDDGSSYLLTEEGTVASREKGSVDRYILAFGKDYLGGLKEFYQLTGAAPLLPKYALGNWWSRYYAYTQDEYLNLMEKFQEKKIPFTVATIDMDWHLVENVPKDIPNKGFLNPRGWTGYTFETSLFPDYKKFFRDLKHMGLAITMNLHPKEGIRYYEEQYPRMAEANGIDPATRDQVEFDFTDQRFIESYFDLVLHPYEEAGVDFWWIDWQQGTESKLAGLDPLWLLNHYHTLDAGRGGRTPLILSRYSGTGSHRYPLGFSGDTIVTWKSLKYQPYFTAMASNVGYSWWSHDIGGHMFSRGNPILYTRWVQYGVFSPINRLHSTRDKWSKEPWLYGEEAEHIVTRYLRLRHRLLPYLYTAGVLTHEEGEPLVMPMYYLNDCSRAYELPDQYYFGRNMIVAPVLTKGDQAGTADVTVWLPAGRWYDFFTGEIYEGDREYTVTCPLDKIAVFVKAGTVLPLLPEDIGNHTGFEELEMVVYPGEGSYRMWDEDGYLDITLHMEGEKPQLAISSHREYQPDSLYVHIVGESEALSYTLEVRS